MIQKTQVRCFAHGDFDMTLGHHTVHGLLCSFHWCMHLITWHSALPTTVACRHVQGLAGMYQA